MLRSFVVQRNRNEKKKERRQFFVFSFLLFEFIVCYFLLSFFLFFILLFFPVLYFRSKDYCIFDSLALNSDCLRICVLKYQELLLFLSIVFALPCIGLVTYTPFSASNLFFKNHSNFLFQSLIY